MKRKGWPLWLLRDVPALLGVMFSFWPLVILLITSARRVTRGKKPRQSFFDDFPLMLAHAEARLTFALRRQAYRRLGWNHRLVRFEIIPACDDWNDSLDRHRNYAQAIRDMDAVVEAYIADIRAQYRISERDLVAHGSTDARLRAHPSKGFAAVREADELVRGTNSSGEARAAQRGHAHARGPPLSLKFGLAVRPPPRKHPLPGPHLHAPTSASPIQASASRY